VERDTHPSLAPSAAALAWPRPASAPEADAARPRFSDLYANHFDFVWRSLRHLGVLEPALDDAVQEVWLTVHRRLDSFEARSAASTWLFGIALNVARSHRRGRQRAGAAEPLPEDVASDRPDPERVLVGQDAWQQVQRFLDTLTELQRAIFICALIETLSPAETALAVGLDVQIVYRRVRALRRGFQRWLERSGEKTP